jgi:hypothetical protein
MSILTMAANSKKASSKPLDNGATSWSRPLPRQVKINVDAAFCADQAEGAIGVVARDYQGQFIAAATRHLPHVSSVAMAEALAMKDGLVLANRLGCNSVVAESDSFETYKLARVKNTGGLTQRRFMLIVLTSPRLLEVCVLSTV